LTWTYINDAFGRRVAGTSGTSHAVHQYGQNGAVFFESRFGGENDYSGSIRRRAKGRVSGPSR
jgi:hypothetical protein